MKRRILKDILENWILTYYWPKAQIPSFFQYSNKVKDHFCWLRWNLYQISLCKIKGQLKTGKASMGVNQKKYNSDRKLNLRLYDNALQFCTAHNDTGGKHSKTWWFLCVYVLTEIGPLEKPRPFLLQDNITQKITLLSKITEEIYSYFIIFAFI